MDLQEIAQAVVMGKAALVKKLVEKALARGLAPSDIRYMVAGMEIVSRRFSQEGLCAGCFDLGRCMQDVVVRPALENAVPLPGKLVIGTVAGSA